MKTLIEYIREAEIKKVAIGHFNISDLVALKAIFESARELSARGESAFGGRLPIIIGVSEGEREFIGVRQVAAFIKSLRGEFSAEGGQEFPIFLNADHTHSLEKIKEAVEAGFDAAVFDPFGAAQGRRGTLEENIKKTKEVMEYAKSVRPEILIEGELGYIGSSSVVFESIPEGAAIKPEDLTKPEEAARFVKETGVDMLAPAVGNIHGMMSGAPNPDLDIKRIAEIHQAAGVPLVLHGGSGITDKDFTASIQAGVSVIHINTEIRLAWRRGLEAALKEKPDEIVPYKLLPRAVAEVKKAVESRLKLFNKIT